MSCFPHTGIHKSTGLTFSLFQDGVKNGVSELDPFLTINSTTVEPTFVYYGGKANHTDWAPQTYGESLSLQSGVVPSLNQGSPLLGPDDDSVLFNSGGAYQASGTTFGNIGTDDIVFELVFKATGTTSIILAKRDGAAGYEIGIDASDRLYITLDDGSSSTVVSAALDSDTWYNAIIAIDRSGNGQIYINGTASGAAVDISSEAGSLDSATALTIGDDSGLDNNAFDSNIGYITMWQGDGWL